MVIAARQAISIGRKNHVDFEEGCGRLHAVRGGVKRVGGGSVGFGRHGRGVVCVDQRIQCRRRYRLPEAARPVSLSGWGPTPKPPRRVCSTARSPPARTPRLTAKGSGFNFAYAGGENSTAKAGGGTRADQPAEPKAFNVAIAQGKGSTSLSPTASATPRSHSVTTTWWAQSVRVTSPQASATTTRWAHRVCSTAR